MLSSLRLVVGKALLFVSAVVVWFLPWAVGLGALITLGGLAAVVAPLEIPVAWSAVSVTVVWAVLFVRPAVGEADARRLASLLSRSWG